MIKPSRGASVGGIKQFCSMTVMMEPAGISTVLPRKRFIEKVCPLPI